MNVRACLSLVVACGLFATVPVAAQTEVLDPSDGFALQTSIASQLDISGAATAAPSFLLGARSGNLLFGAGIGVGFASFKLDDDFRLKGRAITIAPALQADLLESADGRVRGGLAASLGIGHLSGTLEERFYTYDFDSDTEGRIWDKSRASATFLPLRLGFYGDYFVHPGFAVGAEAGVRGAILLSTSTSGGGAADAGFNYQAFYGGVRMTFVFARGGGEG